MTSQPGSERLLAGQALARRLERLSADSHWAHRASGLRGALLRSLDDLAARPQLDPLHAAQFDRLLDQCQYILVKAAGAIRTPDTQFD
jgi:hypothetical protein